MGKSYKSEKSFGPKKRRAGGNYNPRREERQRNRKAKERELNEKLFNLREDPNSYVEYENFVKFREDKPNGK